MINHLWQSSAFAILAGLLVFMLRKSPAKVRYWVWLSASLKFLAPMALLLTLGSVIPTSVPRAIPAPPAILQIAEPFTPVLYAPAPIQAQTNWMPFAIAIAWALGFIAIVVVRYRGWMRIRRALRSAQPVDLRIPIAAVVAEHAAETGVVGFFRPVLVLPPRLLDRLSARQLDAVVAHEMCHVRRRDNFFSAVHMVVEAIFWFHPLVWWIGSRLLEERERACDEEVLRMGCEPADYVEGILKVCRLCQASPLPCVSGVTGADVKKRLRGILSGTIAREWSVRKKAALAAAGLAALATPIAIGVLNAPAIRAQNAAATPKFEVASIKMLAPDSLITMVGGAPSGRRLTMEAMSVSDLISWAYDLKPTQVAGGPSWAGQQRDRSRLDAGVKRFDVTAKADDGSSPSLDDFRRMMQTLLADRFGLKFHRESRETAVYALVVDKNGVRFSGSAPDSKGILRMSGRGHIIGSGATMSQLVGWFSNARGVDRPVLDETALTGRYDFTLEWSNSQEPEDTRPSIFTAMPEQLGLRLEPKRVPLEYIVIDHVQAPTDN